ncbi:hypothetical protein KI688_000103 [Linnemannia hyalina]|uniref:Rap-GAP domain-containing protein n=1 Tax=Linnemannia hyalina TaxID=64524 RepID=A0A9P7Y4U2_9FUNG|nr:hypothetical protein KI688_000103 [Linnemannia hyalina]
MKELLLSNFVAAQSAQGPIVVSIAIDRKGCVRILIRTTQGSERIEHPSSTHSIPWYRKFFLGGFLFNNSNSPSYHLSILSQLCPAIPIESLEPCHHRDLPRELERMEERQVIRSYKFGVVMLLPGQTLEYQGLTNTKESCTPEFLDFLTWLGEPVQLQGWKGYRAGLDVIGDTTGEKSVYTNWNGYQIMYHCAPLMPFNPKDRHQVERRRFIGNDIVVIVFKEDDDDEQFDLSSVGSRQNLAVKDGIRNFSPLHFPTVLQRDDASRDLFLLKLICGERAAYRAKAFATQLSRTRESLLRDVIETHQ